MIQAGLLPKQVVESHTSARFEKPAWYALYTRSRHEKHVSEELRKRGFETFLPVRRVTRQWSDRKKVIEEPLFKSYLFVRAPFVDRWRVINNVQGAVQFVGPRSEPVEVREKDIWAIRRFMDEKIEVDPFPYLKEGQRVYIRSGAFKGAEGFIVRKDSHCRLVITLDALMQSISIKIDQACVEPL